MLYVLYILFFIACITLVGSVLLQPGKTDAGALFTSNVSSSAFGPRGSASILSKITIIAASVFMISAFMISLPALQGGVSVLQSAPAGPESTAPAAISDANANTATEPAPEANTDAAPDEVPADANTNNAANDNTGSETEGKEPASGN